MQLCLVTVVVDGGVKRRHLGAAVEARRPHGNGGAGLELASAAEHTAGATADECAGRERPVDRGEDLIGLGQMSAADEQQGEIGGPAGESDRRHRRRLAGGGAGIRVGRDPGPDRDAHRRTAGSRPQTVLTQIAEFAACAIAPRY